jgi:hypothetical protein
MPDSADHIGTPCVSSRLEHFRCHNRASAHISEIDGANSEQYGELFHLFLSTVRGNAEGSRVCGPGDPGRNPQGR